MGMFDFFDFNHDGKTSSSEMAFGMTMMDDCMNQENDFENETIYSAKSYEGDKYSNCGYPQKDYAPSPPVKYDFILIITGLICIIGYGIMIIACKPFFIVLLPLILIIVSHFI